MVHREAKIHKRPAKSECMKLYLVRHEGGRETTVNGHNRYEAALAAAREWGIPWTSIARKGQIIELITENEVRDL